MKALLLMCMLLGLGACASQPRDEAAAKEGATTDDPEQHCLRETGTKIKNDKRCVHGRVITAEEMEQSGATTVDEVLKRLPR